LNALSIGKYLHYNVVLLNAWLLLLFSYQQFAVSLLAASVGGVRVVSIGPLIVRVTWEPINITELDLNSYSYIIYYSQSQMPEAERNTLVPITADFVLIRDLDGNVEYGFMVAVVREVDLEKYAGARSTLVRTLVIPRGQDVNGKSNAEGDTITLIAAGGFLILPVSASGGGVLLAVVIVIICVFRIRRFVGVVPLH
jgi:hypothetical protein